MTVPVHLVLGDEALLVQRAVTGLIEEGLAGGNRSLSLAEFRANEAEGALAVARTQPMMSRRRVVVVRELELAPAGLLDALLEYVEQPSASTVLVLTGRKLPPPAGGIDRGKRLSNRVKKVGEVRRFKAGAEDPHRFARAHVEAAGCTLDARAARLVVELAGRDLGALRGELDKAIAFVGGSGKIDSDVIAAVCSVVAEADQWSLANALVRGDRDAALAATHRILEESVSVHLLLGQVAWQVRQLLELQSATRRRAELPGSWRRAPGSKLSAARRTLDRRPLDAARILSALARTNRALNRSRAGPRLVFEALVLELTT